MSDLHPPSSMLQEGISIQEALDQEAIRVERWVANVGILLALVGCLLSLYLLFAFDRHFGTLLLAMTTASLLWFFFSQQLLKRGQGTRLLPFLSPLVEISLPSALFFSFASGEDAKKAMYLTAPLQLYAIVTAVSIARLRTFTPLLISMVGAVEYAIIYALIIYPTLPKLTPLDPLITPNAVLIRAILIVTGGLSASLISKALRSVASQAAGEVRSRDLFGKYRIGEILGSGGMGEVYRATYCPEGGFERPVAIKRIHTHLAREANFVRRFRNEARICARLIHNNIVQVIDFGRVGDTYFQAMEYVDGYTLLDLMQHCQKQERWIPPALCAFIGLQVSRGLSYAHAEARDENGVLLRVIHRDLSPANILISKTGQVKVLDFGIARALGDTTIEQTQQVMGKFGYMAPEQATGELVDERCDLFALSVTLWELVCLRPLFGRPTEAQTLLALLSEPVEPAAQYRSDLGASEWSELFSLGLERNPTLRFQRAVDMETLLERIWQKEGRSHQDELVEFLREIELL